MHEKPSFKITFLAESFSKWALILEENDFSLHNTGPVMKTLQRSSNSSAFYLSFRYSSEKVSFYIYYATIMVFKIVL